MNRLKRNNSMLNISGNNISRLRCQTGMRPTPRTFLPSKDEPINALTSSARIAINIPRILIISVCIIGCAYQSFTILTIFYSYPTVTQVRIEYSQLFPLPALSLCINVQRDFGPEEISNLKGRRVENAKYISKEDIFLNETMSQMFGTNRKHDGIAIKEMIKQGRLNVTTRINTDYQVITFNYRPDGSDLLVDRISDLYGSRYLYSIHFELNCTNCTTIWFSIHASYLIPNCWESFNMMMERESHVDVDYKRTKTISIGKPYSSCIDYPTIGFPSLDDCLRQCAINITQDACNQTLPLKVNVDLTQEGVLPFENDSCVGEIYHESICATRCPFKQCVKEYYDAKIISTEKLGRNKYGMTVWASPQPDLISESAPKYDTIEIICYLASIFGLWFGFAIAPLYMDVESLMKNRRWKQIVKKIMKQNFALK